MFLAKDLPAYSKERELLEDTRWLDDAKRSIQRTSPLRDRLGANAAGVENTYKAEPIQRPYLHLSSSAVRPGLMADPKRFPLQRGQYQILVEAARNIWISEGAPQHHEPLMRELTRSFSYLDSILMAHRPVEKNEKTYEVWWRGAIKAMPPDQYKSVVNGLAEMEGYFSTHSPMSTSEVLNRSASQLMAQMTFAKLPSLKEKKGNSITTLVARGCSILEALGPPWSLLGHVGKALVTEKPDKDIEVEVEVGQ